MRHFSIHHGCYRRKGEERLSGVNWVPGSGEDQSAYRSELAGAVGILASTAILIKHYKITKGCLTIAFDGQSALNEAAGEWPFSIDQPCFDLLQEIWNRVQSLPIDITWKRVEGHQKEKGRQHLDWWGRRNADIDK